MENNVFREERLRMILKILSEEKKIIVKDLAEKFNLSDSSIRLDLTELESRGLIYRTHGGAIMPNETQNDLVLNKNILAQREDTFAEEKQKIALAILDFINDGDSIMIDGGSTNYYIARQLNQKRGLTIITTSTHLLPVLAQISDANIFLSGGLFQREFEDTIGEIALEMMGRFRPDKTIMGIDGISLKQGLTCTEPSMAPLKKKMVNISKHLIVVADSSKIGKVCLVHVAGLNEVKTIVTDNRISEKDRNAISDSGPEVVAA
jgi:DeoR/GlpR family transcriptional regulator of sugar metabolism